jgi:hypothetical protein
MYSSPPNSSRPIFAGMAQFIHKDRQQHFREVRSKGRPIARWAKLCAHLTSGRHEAAMGAAQTLMHQAAHEKADVPWTTIP